tara:strand:- start:3099 stop:3281 length:183 start_codon:yes stop_codon:yes gene_type:complete
MLTFSTPIGIPEIHPQTTIISKDLSGCIEHIGEFGNEGGRMRLKTNLTFDIIVSLTIKRG